MAGIRNRDRFAGLGWSAVLWMALLLAPSAAFVAAFSDLPNFGQSHDEGLYFVSAKSLTDGGGYRIASLPQEPPQTKYPPLYPALLSIAWRLNPEFPANLRIAAWVNWAALPLIAAQLLWLCRRWGFSGRRSLVVAGLVVANPYTVRLSTQLLSELWFLAFVLAAVVLLEKAAEQRPRSGWVLASGLLAGMAYLTRSAGLALLPAAVLFLVVRFGRTGLRMAALFGAAMLPFVGGWMLWVRTHQTATADPALYFYLDYGRYQLFNVALSDVPVVLWKNIDALLWGLGGFILPRAVDSLLLKILAQVIAIAMLSGVVRLWKSGSARPLAMFAGLSVMLLAVWHFPPDERFVLPVFPVAAAGLLVELEHFAGLLGAARSHSDPSQRAAGRVMAGVAGVVALGIVALQIYIGLWHLPETAREQRVRREARLAEYQWIREQTPLQAAILSANDPLVFLYTGRHAMRDTLPPKFWYRDDHAAMVDWLGDPRRFAEAHGLGYIQHDRSVLTEGMEDSDRERVAVRVESDPGLTPLFHKGPVTVFGRKSGRESEPARAGLR